MEINQVLVAASPGDAITNAALDIRNVLRDICEAEVYARYYDPRLEGEVLPLNEMRRRRSARPEQNILMYHASIGEPEVFAFLQQRPEQLVIVHHNISPPEPFLPYDPAFAGLLDEGRRELAALSRRAVLALADSDYNARDLAGLGYRDVRLSPLILDIERLLHSESHEPTDSHLRQNVEGPVIAFVGQLLPHKRPDFLIQAYHALITYLEPEAYLLLIGTSRLPRYTTALEQLIRELNLPRAWVTGRIQDSELVSFYRRANVFVTASEHEGFCAPLVEAMAFEVPVVARAFAAVPETLGGAGLLLPAEDGPLLAAEAIHEVLTNDPLRKDLTKLGRDRAADFNPEKTRAILLSHLLELV